MHLLLVADVALLGVLAVRGTGSNLPLLGYLFMGNILFVAARRGWSGFCNGGTIAVVAFLGACWLCPDRVAAAYESFVLPVSVPLEEVLFTDQVAGEYATGTAYGLAEGYSAAALVNLLESFLISLPLIGIAFSVAFFPGRRSSTP
jgi:hypothetical protein